MSRRQEAQDHLTSPQRLHELIHLPGDHGDIDSDSGWCREYVAANPSATPETLAELAGSEHDFYVRKFVAGNPATPVAVIELLAEDTNPFVANVALERLGRSPRGTEISDTRTTFTNASAAHALWLQTLHGKRIS